MSPFVIDPMGGGRPVPEPGIDAAGTAAPGVAPCPDRDAHESHQRGARFVAALGMAAVVLGVYQAVLLAWTSDDAYISFRYARNLVDGLGLVYNAGERVEGYTNFLWTLWCALGLRLGCSAEAWANAASIACFAATIALLAVLAWRRARAGVAGTLLPLAALAVAVNRSACEFATSGLETSLFTLLVVAGYVALVGLGSSPRGDLRRALAAAALFGLATLTRPDGVLFAALAGAYVLVAARPRLRATLAYAAALAAIGIPFALWKLAYYGDLLPNTYYAKSAMIPWWDQGWAYTAFYFQRYPALLAGPLLVLALAPVAWRRRTRAVADALGATSLPVLPALLATAFALAYSAYVMRVGGDFMFGRLLIPATPFYALALELGLGPLVSGLRLPSRRWLVPAAALPAVLALPAMAFAPSPIEGTGAVVEGQGYVRGIVNERDYYVQIDRASSIRRAEELRELTRGLPVRAVIAGTQALAGYYSGIPTVIEASAGLTDAFVAHQRLAHRGRVGHEKRAPFAYLIDRRRAHLHVGRPDLQDSLRAYIPMMTLRYKTMKATLLTWDPALMGELRRRGARCDDFPALLDRFIAEMPGLSDSVVAAMYVKSRRFYFDGVSDPVRAAAFERRLPRSFPSGTRPGF